MRDSYLYVNNNNNHNNQRADELFTWQANIWELMSCSLGHNHNHHNHNHNNDNNQ